MVNIKPQKMKRALFIIKAKFNTRDKIITYTICIGHAFIKARMREENALYAGELSGHYYYRDMGFTDNALFTMIQMLNFLSLKKQPLSDLIRPLQTYYATGEINIRVKDKDSVFTALEANYNDAQKDHLDGLTIGYDTWWFNLRASNTEPLMRLNLEAADLITKEEKRKEVLNIIGEADHSMTIES